MPGNKLIIKAVVLFFVVTNISFSQVSEAVVGVDGFTCSLCAKGVEGQFKALNYVKSVKTDLKKTQFTLAFNSKTVIDFKEIRDAVTDGGFTLREIDITAKGLLKTDGSSFFLLDAKNSPELKLKGLKGKFKNGEKIVVKGKLNVSDNTVSVSSVKGIE